MAKRKTKAKPRKKIAAAVGSATAVRSGGPILRQMISDARTAAIQEAVAEGVSVYDVEELQKRQHAAGEEAKAKFAAMPAGPDGEQ